MRVVVTGGWGKVGREVVRALRREEPPLGAHEVTVFDAAAGPDEPGVRAVRGDAGDLGQVLAALRGADAVVHLAAVPRFGMLPDDVTFRTNVAAGFNVHEAAARLGVRRVVSASSDAVLGWNYRRRDFLPAYLPIDEDHPLQPQDPYGLSKQVGEAIARSYAERGACEAVVLRPPGVKSSEQMAALRAARGVRPERFDLLTYVDVRDLADAFRLAVERPLPPFTVLLTPADDSTVAEPLSNLLPRLVPELGGLAAELTGSRALVSNARAKATLGWRPRRSWRTGEAGVAAEPAEPGTPAGPAGQA